MVMTDEQKQAIMDVAATGAALGKLRPLFSKAQLPTPFHFPSAASWNRNDGGDASDYYNDNKNTGKPVVYAGTFPDVGTLRTTCAFLIHGDPKMHKLTSVTLKWVAKKKGKQQ